MNPFCGKRIFEMVIMIERRNCYGKNTELLSKALRLLPEVKNTVVHPNEGQEYSKPLGKGDSVRIDFGRHLVGHLKLKLGYTDSHPDAPVWLKFSFAENLKEFDEDVENYNGWICSAWVQQNRFMWMLFQEIMNFLEDIHSDM